MRVCMGSWVCPECGGTEVELCLDVRMKTSYVKVTGEAARLAGKRPREVGENCRPAVLPALLLNVAGLAPSPAKDHDLQNHVWDDHVEAASFLTCLLPWCLHVFWIGDAFAPRHDLPPSHDQCLPPRFLMPP